MANSLTASHGQYLPQERSASCQAPRGYARHKLDRLRELRAVIQTLHRDLETQDPLLAWILEQESVENHWRD